MPDRSLRRRYHKTNRAVFGVARRGQNRGRDIGPREPTGTRLCHDRVTLQETPYVKEFLSRVSFPELSHDTLKDLSWTSPSHWTGHVREIGQLVFLDQPLPSPKWLSIGLASDRAKPNALNASRHLSRHDRDISKDVV